MAKGFLTVKDLSLELRRSGAARARAKIRDMLANPFLPQWQRDIFNNQLSQVDEWEKGNGQVMVAPPSIINQADNTPTPPRVGTNHDVSVSEDLSVTEDT